ncbi:MAG: PDZ domain-containing protein, partial [Candidatus Kuenenia stuttgartiensis]|nr:PDZ domain-containing protein [Candidatus Kuenenia stuttgartiensis]
DKKLIIQKLSEGSPAEKAGLMAGDVILAVDGKAMNTVAELVHYLQTKQFGDSCTVNIDRDGTKITYAVTLFEMK